MASTTTTTTERQQQQQQGPNIEGRQNHHHMKKHVVGIVIFDGVEVLDYCGPYEVFSVTRISSGGDEQADDHQEGTTPTPTQPITSAPATQFGFDVKLVAYSTDQPIVTVGGMHVLPQVSFADCPPLDTLLIPGGIGTRNLPHKQETIDFIRKQASNHVDILSSVCTGALVLGEAGLLDGRQATTHYASLDLLQQTYPSVEVARDKHWVVRPNCSSSSTTTSPPGLPTNSGDNKEEENDEGVNHYTLFTSAGISAGIDMALKIVQHVYGESVARATAHYMEYPFPESQERRI